MRTITKFAVLLAATLLPIAAQAQAEKKLVAVASGGEFERTMNEQFYLPFKAQEGVQVQPLAVGLGQQWARAQAMQTTNTVEWDLVTAIPGDFVNANRELLEPIDCERLAAGLANAVKGACSELGLMRGAGAGVMVWNTGSFGGQTPRSWADFWDVARFPGPRALPNLQYTQPWVLMIALLADGVPRDQLFPLDVDRAFRKLEQIKPHVSVWWSTGDQSQNAFRNKEAVMGLMWSTRATPTIKEGAPIDFTYTDSIRDMAYWSVLRGSRNKDAAFKFLAFYLQNPKAHAEAGIKLGLGMPNTAAIDLLPDSEKRLMATAPENWNAQLVADAQWTAQHAAALNTRFQTFLSR